MMQTILLSLMSIAGFAIAAGCFAMMVKHP